MKVRLIICIFSSMLSLNLFAVPVNKNDFHQPCAVDTYMAATKVGELTVKATQSAKNYACESGAISATAGAFVGDMVGRKLGHEAVGTAIGTFVGYELHNFVCK